MIRLRLIYARLKLVWRWRAAGFRNAYAQTRLLCAAGYLIGTYALEDRTPLIDAINLLFDAMERVSPC